MKTAERNLRNAVKIYKENRDDILRSISDKRGNNYNEEAYDSFKGIVGGLE